MFQYIKLLARTSNNYYGGEMNPLASLQKDTVYIENNVGERSAPYKTAIGSKGGLSATIFDKNVNVEEGWKLIRDLPNNKEESYTIVEVNFSAGLHSIPAGWKLKLRKDSSLLQSKKPETRNTTINISNSQGIQVGDNNTQTIELGFQELIEKIESSEVSDSEKSEAKGALKALMENPVVAGILGGAASGIFSLLG